MLLLAPQAFERFGRVKDCQVVCDKHGASRGFGFVVFERRQHAKAAKQHLDGASAVSSRQLKARRRRPFAAFAQKWHGRSPHHAAPLQVRWARDPAILFVGDLSPAIGEGALLEAFKQFGDVVRAYAALLAHCAAATPA